MEIRPDMSPYQLKPEEVAMDQDTRQPALWASLIVFIIIDNLAIFARIWIKWGTNLNRKRVTAEDIFVCCFTGSAKICVLPQEPLPRPHLLLSSSINGRGR